MPLRRARVTPEGTQPLSDSTGTRLVPGIRGLRALAVVAVIIYHYFINLLPGGYLGVDLFFVISGFLITSLLLRERALHGSISLQQFWKRRVRRILPAAALVLVVGSAIAGLIGGDVTVHLARQFFSSLFFVNNWVQIHNAESYFAPNELPIFAHYWSLSVEEQFYIFWPLVMAFLLWLRLGKKTIALICGLLALASASWMAALYTPGEDPTRVYYGTDTHAFGLFLGAVLALFTISHSFKKDGPTWSYSRGILRYPILWRVLGPVALVGQLLLFYFLDDQNPLTYRGGLLLSTVLAALLIAAAVRQVGVVHWVFSRRILQWIGDRSFSMYLWHVPVHVFLIALNTNHTWELNDAVIGGLALLITVVLSHLSYTFVEEPFRIQGYRKQMASYRKQLKSSQKFKRVRSWGLAATLVATLGLSTTALATANTETEMERDLRIIAEQMQQQAEAQAAAAASREAEIAQRKMPTGDQITAIGDSVLLASAAALQEEFPGIYIDGAVSRHYDRAAGIIQQMEEAGTLDRFVLLSFGTNGSAFEGQIDELVELLGEDRVIVLLMPYGDRWWMEQSQKEVVQAAKRYDNVYAMDWCGYVKKDPSVLRSDGIHPEPKGAAGYAKVFRETLQQWVDGEKEYPAICGP